MAVDAAILFSDSANSSASNVRVWVGIALRVRDAVGVGALIGVGLRFQVRV